MKLAFGFSFNSLERDNNPFVWFAILLHTRLYLRFSINKKCLFLTPKIVQTKTTPKQSIVRELTFSSLAGLFHIAKLKRELSLKELHIRRGGLASKPSQSLKQLFRCKPSFFFASVLSNPNTKKAGGNALIGKNRLNSRLKLLAGELRDLKPCLT